MGKPKVIVVKHKLDIAEATIKGLAIARAAMATYGTYLIVKTIAHYTSNGKGFFAGTLEELEQIDKKIDEQFAKAKTQREELSKTKVEGE